MTTPLVSVIIPVYNAETFVAEAVQSILDQTLTDFELLVLDDGSTDKSVAILERFHDKRIQIRRSEKNTGLIATLNRGLDLAKGRYIARMDADDISLPARLAKQVDFLEKNPSAGVVGTATTSFGNEKQIITRYLQTHGEICTVLLFNSAMSHPSVMLRNSVLKQFGLRYDPQFLHAEDYDLWTRIAVVSELANLPEVLLMYRVHAAQLTQKEKRTVRSTAGIVRQRQLKLLGIIPDEAEASIHDKIANGHVFRGIDQLRELELWLLKLIDANQREKIYPLLFFNEYLVNIWISACGNSGEGVKAYRIATHSPLFDFAGNRSKNRLKLLIKSIIR
ncbi:MAG TPA: glycosyltransferase [Bacteroidia bacterium]|nr:glycosyltransferase [Bacteroidia bacterium]